ncbi:MAG: hypothetical protein UY18_C0020G0001, partial [Microgenomates group bacterium GW2011_GWF2_47_9]
MSEFAEWEMYLPPSELPTPDDQDAAVRGLFSWRGDVGHSGAENPTLYQRLGLDPHLPVEVISVDRRVFSTAGVNSPAGEFGLTLLVQGNLGEPGSRAVPRFGRIAPKGLEGVKDLEGVLASISGSMGVTKLNIDNLSALPALAERASKRYIGELARLNNSPELTGVLEAAGEYAVVRFLGKEGVSRVAVSHLQEEVNGLMAEREVPQLEVQKLLQKMTVAVSAGFTEKVIEGAKQELSGASGEWNELLKSLRRGIEQRYERILQILQQ